jgi:polysaccharide pyruvyl transferase WcaK-like protein
MKITLNGYYGFSNYGDDLFNLTSVLGAARWWPGHEVDILGPPVKGINSPFRVPAWFPKALYTAPGLGGKVSRLAFLSGALAARDLLVYAGGSTLSHGSLLKRLQRVAAEREWTRFSAIGVSVGPFSDAADEAEAARFLRRFSFVSVRDRQSLAFLERMQVPYEPVMARDLVGALPLLLPAASSASPGPGARRTLGVSLRLFECHSGGDTVKEDQRNAALMEGISRFAHREDVMVRIFCLNTHPRWGDMTLSRRLQDQIVRQGAVAEMVSCEDPLLGNWHGLAACTAVLCVRMHAGITAYLTEVPFALVEYHEKCTDYLDDIGQARELRLGGNLDDPEQVVAILDRLFHNAPRPALPAYTYAREAAANFTAAPWAVTLPESTMEAGTTNANAPG